MTKQSKTVRKQSRGRPAGVKFGETVPARFELATVANLNKWAASHSVSRSEAIRRLVEIGLTVKTRAAPTQRLAARVSEPAAKTIEMVIDPSAPPEERAQRRRRLTKGPPEFREDRVDLPKAKGK